MAAGIIIEPLRIGFNQRARCRRQAHVAPIRHATRIDRVAGKIDAGAVFAQYRPGAAAHGGEHFFEVAEIIFGVGQRDAIGNIGIGLAMDVRHAPLVALDLHLPRPHRIGIRRAGAERVPRRKPHHHGGDGNAAPEQRGEPARHQRASFTTRPPFTTIFTSRSSVTSRVGSPANAMMSA